MITDMSRDIDLLCGGRTFYSRTETQYFNKPCTGDRQLDMIDDLLAVTTLTNGNGDVIAAADYLLMDKGKPPYYAIRLTQSTQVYWQGDDDGNTEQIITIAGTWGYVNRSDTDARSARVIRATHDLVIAMVMNEYHKRYGDSPGGVATVTDAGVVITPDDIPALKRKVLQSFGKKF